jgi:chorismate dehydratase
MSIRVGHVPYLNCEPFYFDMERRGIELVERLPNATLSDIQEGEIQGGIVPLSQCFSMDESLQYLSGFCLSSITRATSVNLYSKRPIEELSGTPIAVFGEAVTSFHLLQVLLGLKYQVEPEGYVTLDDPHEAFLLMGNHGLRYRRGVRGFPHRYDLGEEWYGWTGLPFVFARWVVRQDMERMDSVVLEDALYTGLQDWADGLFRISETRNNLLMRPQDILEYTQGLRYFIGVPEQRAIDLFQEYLAQVPTSGN